jgi:hypothetical protein
MPSEQGTSDFDNFYETTYKGQHRNKVNRALHLIGLVAGVAGTVYGAVQSNYIAIPVSIIGGYALTLFGHIAFEGNFPKPFKHAHWGLFGNLKSSAEFVTGK